MRSVASERRDLDASRNFRRKAGAAIDRSIAARTKWNGRGHAAFGAHGLECRARRRNAVAVLRTTNLTAIAAALRLILEPLIGKKLLLPRRKQELAAAFLASEHLIFHRSEPPVGFR
jgi:hypothetical protein